MRLPTIRVSDKSARGFRTINESDFDPDAHTIYTGEPAPVPAPPPEAPPEVDMTDVKDMTWPQLRSLAADVSDSPIMTKEDAIEAIRLHRIAQAGAD